MAEPTVLSGPPAPDSPEGLQRVQDAMHAQLDAIASRAEERMLEGMAEIIARYEKPNPSRIPTLVNSAGDTVITTSRAWDSSPERMRLPEEERKYRTWDGDHYMRSWLKAMQEGDYAGRVQADGKLQTIFPALYRADTLEGAATTTGAFPAGTGGVLIPRPIEALVAVALSKVAKMYRWARTYTMTSQTSQIPTAGAATAYMQGEATSPLTGGEPGLAQVVLTAYNAMGKLILGRDFLDDEAQNVIPVFVQLMGDALAELEDSEFLRLGTGTAPHPTKLTPLLFTETTSAALGFGDVVKMYADVPQRYRDNGMWLVNPTVLRLMAGVRDGNGRQLYTDMLRPPQFIGDTANASMYDGAVGTIFGKPVHEVDLTAGEIFFGDVSRAYAIGRRRGITVEASRDFLFDTRRVIWLVSERIAGNNVDTTAGLLCQGITSATSL